MWFICLTIINVRVLTTSLLLIAIVRQFFQQHRRGAILGKGVIHPFVGFGFMKAIWLNGNLILYNIVNSSCSRLGVTVFVVKKLLDTSQLSYRGEILIIVLLVRQTWSLVHSWVTHYFYRYPNWLDNYSKIWSVLLY